MTGAPKRRSRKTLLRRAAVVFVAYCFVAAIFSLMEPPFGDLGARMIRAPVRIIGAVLFFALVIELLCLSIGSPGPIIDFLFLREDSRTAREFEKQQAERAESEAEEKARSREAGIAALNRAGCTAITNLRPSGKILIDGKRADARSVSGFIESGARVRIIDRAAGEYVVEELTADPGGDAGIPSRHQPRTPGNAAT